MDSKDIRDLNKIYMEAVYGGGKKVEKKDTRLTVTAADKKANTKAYQNYKAGNKAYKAADHLGEGKAESPEAEEEKDKKDDNLAGAPNKKGKKAKRWWDDDGDGKGYEDGEVDGKFPKKKEVKEGKNGDCVSKSEKGDHNCAKKVCHEKYGIGNCIEGQHTILEDGTVGHYDVEFEEYIVENCPVEELEILVSEMHMHKEMKEGVVSKEVKELQKAGKTLKDTPVVKADKTDTPNYKGNKFGVKEDKDWIQNAVKRPGAFTRKAKAAGMGVQQFAKNVDDNPGKYSTRTKKQANLAQTFASMKKEDVEELFYTLIAE